MKDSVKGTEIPLNAKTLFCPNIVLLPSISGLSLLEIFNVPDLSSLFLISFYFAA
jgi:hypothetical protein